jgi:hypothetical protein
MEKVFHIEQFFHWKYIYIKIKNIRKFGHALDIVGKHWVTRI